MAKRTGLIAGASLAGAAAAGWLAAQSKDRSAVKSDPNYGPLFEPLPGVYKAVEASDGTRLAARVFGPEGAPTIIFIHGWTCSDEFWKLQIAALRGERRIIAYDQRGHAESERARNHDYSIEQFGRDLDCVIEQLVPEGERALLVGHSLGAMTIATWAGQYPEKVEQRASAAMLCNTGVGGLINESLITEGLPDLPGQVERIVGEQVLKARAPLPALTTPISYRMVHYVALGPHATPAQIAFTERLVLDCPADVRGRVGGTLSKLDLYEALGKLTVPTLVLCGSKDRLTPPIHAHQMAAALPNVLDVVEIPESGHMSPLEFPDRVNELVAEMAGSHATVAA